MRKNLASIKEDGLRARYYGTNFRGFGHPYLTLFRSKENASLPGREVVITFHVPDDEASRYLGLDSNGWEAGLAGLLQPLPPRMIAAVEDL